MKTTHPKTQHSRFLATRIAVLATAAPWRRSASLATLALGLAGIISTAHATLLVYEGFDYAAPATGGQFTATSLTSLNGQTVSVATENNPTGLTGAWSAGQTNTSVYPNPYGFAICNNTFQTIWNGTSTSLTQTGKFAGSPAPVMANGSLNGNNPDHLWAYRSIDPTVTATFTLGTTTWMSFEQSSNFKANANGLGMSFAIGAGNLGDATGEDRGIASKGGGAVGIWMNYNDHRFTAAAWGSGIAAGNAAGTYAVSGNPTTLANGGTGPVSYGGQWFTTNTSNPYVQNDATTPKICIAKIIWGDTLTPTTIKLAVFNEGVALSTLNEQGFDNVAVSYTTLANPDPLTYNKIAMGGGRCNVDELRIGTTLNDAIGVVIASTGNYWAAEGTGGGTGTWNASSAVWATAPGVAGSGTQAATGTLIFGNAPGTVTINGTVSTVAGLNFLSNYSLIPDASSPTLHLTGADAAANEISVDIGKTATISADVTGSTGLTKDGSGTLVLSSITNSYGGGTMLNLGTLQLTDIACLGTGNVTFGGGTLQYPTGSGISAIDFSSKISTVASGQVAMIDTDGHDVTFGAAIAGTGGFTKLGAGSLTLGAAIPSGTTTVSAGTLNVSSASGTIATLNVPTGGTVNLGTGAVVTTLHITGGTVHITGTNVQVGTLVGNSGTLEAITPFAVTTRATVAGVSLSLGGAASFTLSGANVIAPDSANPRMVAATGGTLGFVGTGFDTAIGIAGPGSNAVPTTATFGGSGVWTLTDGIAIGLGNVYGKDNHAFHYMQIPAGDFSIKAHVTGATNAQAGLMVRNVLGSAPQPAPLPPNTLPYAPAGTGNWVGIWNQLEASNMDGAAEISMQGINATGNTPYLQITKSGNVITSYYSTDGVNYILARQRDFSASSSGWGANTYVGLDLTQTAVTSVSGAFDNVNFMGTASMPDLSTTELVLSGGAKANVDCRMRLAKLTIGTDVQLAGAYTAVNTPGSISGSEAIIIGDNSATVTLADLSHTYDGSAKSATATSIPALTVNITYNGSTDKPVNSGSYITQAVIVDPYYTGLAMGTLVIGKAPATVTLGSLIRYYDGNPKPATAITTPAGLPVTFTYDGLATVPSAVGSYAVVGTLNDPNYAAENATGTLVINAASDYNSWANIYLPADVSNPAGDNDGDGLTNFQEYAFGLNPTSGVSCNPITQQLEQTTGVFKYTRRATPATTGLTYTVLTSPNLKTWTPDAGANESFAISGGVETVTFTLNGAPLSTPKLFVRVEVTQP